MYRYISIDKFTLKIYYLLGYFNAIRFKEPICEDWCNITLCLNITGWTPSLNGLKSSKTARENSAALTFFLCAAEYNDLCIVIARLKDDVTWDCTILRYIAWTPDNHDFIFGLQRLTKARKQGSKTES